MPLDRRPGLGVKRLGQPADMEQRLKAVGLVMGAKQESGEVSLARYWCSRCKDTTFVLRTRETYDKPNGETIPYRHVEACRCTGFNRMGCAKRARIQHLQNQKQGHLGAAESDQK